MTDPEPVLHGPAHPVHALTTGELSTYRRQLEHAVTILKDAPVVEDLHKRLDEVCAEEEERARIRRTIQPDEIDARTRHHSA